MLQERGGLPGGSPAPTPGGRAQHNPAQVRYPPIRPLMSQIKKEGEKTSTAEAVDKDDATGSGPPPPPLSKNTVVVLPNQTRVSLGELVASGNKVMLRKKPPANGGGPGEATQVVLGNLGGDSSMIDKRLSGGQQLYKCSCCNRMLPKVVFLAHQRMLKVGVLLQIFASVLIL